MELAKWVTIRVMDTAHKESFPTCKSRLPQKSCLLLPAAKEKCSNLNTKESWGLEDSWSMSQQC